MNVDTNANSKPASGLPPVPDPYVFPLRNNAILVDSIAEVTGQSLDEVRQRFRKEHHQIGSNVWEEFQRWGLDPFVWSDKLVDFYSKSDMFIYETLVWNRSAMKNQMRKWIAEFLARDFARPAKILMYGDGLGFDSLYLAQAGHDVTSFEVSEICVKFAKSIFNLSSVTVRTFSCPDEVECEAFDVIVCLDVLEHIPNPPVLVRQLAAALKPGGRLIVHAPFFYFAPHVATHLRTNKKYSGDLAKLYFPNGLYPIDGKFFWDPIVLEKRNQDIARRSRYTGREAMLRLSGLFLAVGRFWSLPHIWVIHLLFMLDQKRLREMLTEP